MNPIRERRLAAEQQRVVAEFAGHPRISVEPFPPDPAEQYLVTYRVRSLRWDEAHGAPLVIGLHRMLVQLPMGYPRENPRCIMQQPVFHPNFGNWVCVSDAWGAAQTLVDLIYQVGDMLQFRTYNLRSPMNAEAARWVKEHLDQLPVDHLDLTERPAEGRESGE